MIAAAGEIKNQKVKLTNNNLVIDVKEIKKNLSIKNVFRYSKS